MLFHLRILDSPAPPFQVMLPFETRMAGVAGPQRAMFVACLRRKSATCRLETLAPALASYSLPARRHQPAWACLCGMGLWTLT